MGTRWTEGDKLAVKAWLIEKRSSTFIAKALRRSRSSVIATIHRDPELKAIGLSGPNPFADPGVRAECSSRALEVRRANAGERAKVKAERAAQRKALNPMSARRNRRKAMRGGFVAKNRLKPVVVKAPPPPAFVPASGGVSLMDLGPRQCKFCINEPEQGMAAHLFCGEVTERGSSWCPHHEQIVWGKATAGETETVQDAERIA